MSAPVNSAAAVKVMVRLRPMNEKEKQEGTLPVVSNSTERKLISVIKQKKCFQYKFNNVFGSFSTQQEVFEESLQPLIEDVMKGYETCVFAYGQTGTGKTYTMEGNLGNPDEHGVIPRSAQALFAKLKNTRGVLSYQVSCSYLEIYNEELSDLLAASPSAGKSKLDVLSSGGKNGTTSVRGLSSRIVHSAEEVLDCMTTATQARRVGETNMNKQSSRSHCIFTIMVEAKRRVNQEGDIMECKGKLHLVDLAGSESAKTAELKMTSACDQAAREQERRNINKSLLSLGRVIQGLAEQSKSSGKSSAVIPYRDSKLTRILQEALGGRCKTIVIATVSPSILNLNESLQTLQYATQAMGIQNKPVSTSFMSLTPSKRHRPNDSDSITSAVPDDQWHDMVIRMQHMRREVEEARAALARKYLLQQELEERLAKSEDAMQELENRVEESKREVSSLRIMAEEERVAKEEAVEELHKTKEALQKTNVVLKATQNTEALLTQEAKTLLCQLQKSLGESDKFYKMLESGHACNLAKKDAARDFTNEVIILLQEAAKELNQFQKEELCQKERTESELLENQRKFQSLLGSVGAILSSFEGTVLTTGSSIDRALRENLEPTIDFIDKEVERSGGMIHTTLEEGDVKLSECCDKFQEKWEGMNSELRSYKESFQAASKNTSTSIRQHLEATQANIHDIVRSSSKRMDAILQRSHTTRTRLEENLGTLQSITAKSVGDITSAAEKQKAKLVQSRRLILDSEQEHHGKALSNLSAQRDMIERYDVLQTQRLVEQSQLLQLQQAELEQSQTLQRQMCDDMIQNVLNNVEQMLTEQVQNILATGSKSSEVLGANNGKLNRLVNDIRESGREMKDQTVEANGVVGGSLDAIKATNDTVSPVLAQVESAIGDMSGTTQNLIADHSSTVEEMQQGLDALHVIANDVQSAQQSLSREGMACADYCSETALAQSRELLAHLEGRGQNAIDFASISMSTYAKETVEKIKEPRADIRKAVFGCLEDLSVGIQNKTDGARISLKDQIQTTGNLTKTANEVLADVVELNRNLDSLYLENHQRFMSATEQSHQSLNSVVTACKLNLNKSNQRAVEFATQVMEVDGPVAPLPEKNSVTYKESLSSTPPEDEILKDFPGQSIIGHGFGNADVESKENSKLATTILATGAGASVLRERSTNTETTKATSSRVKAIEREPTKGGIPAPKRSSRLPKRVRTN